MTLEECRILYDDPRFRGSLRNTGPALCPVTRPVTEESAVSLLQDHFAGDFTASLNVVPRSYRAWRDPVALLCAFAASALALRFALGRMHRFELALGVVGCTFAAACGTQPGWGRVRR